MFTSATAVQEQPVLTGTYRARSRLGVFLIVRALVLLCVGLPSWVCAQDTGNITFFIEGFQGATSTYPESVMRVYIQVWDPDRDENSETIDSVEVVLTSPSDVDEPLLLLESGPATGRFQGWMDLDHQSPGALDGHLQGRTGERIGATYLDPSDNFGNLAVVVRTAQSCPAVNVMVAADI